MLRSFILFAGLFLALGLAGCPQQAEQPVGDAEVTEEEVVIEEVPADSGAEAPADSDTMEEPPADAGSDDGAGDDNSQ